MAINPQILFAGMPENPGAAYYTGVGLANQARAAEVMTARARLQEYQNQRDKDQKIQQAIKESTSPSGEVDYNVFSRKAAAIDPVFAMKFRKEREEASVAKTTAEAHLVNAQAAATRAMAQKSLEEQRVRRSQGEHVAQLMEGYEQAATKIQDPVQRQQLWATNVYPVLKKYEVPGVTDKEPTPQQVTLWKTAGKHLAEAGKNMDSIEKIARSIPGGMAVDPDTGKEMLNLENPTVKSLLDKATRIPTPAERAPRTKLTEVMVDGTPMKAIIDMDTGSITPVAPAASKPGAGKLAPGTAKEVAGNQSSIDLANRTLAELDKDPDAVGLKNVIGAIPFVGGQLQQRLNSKSITIATLLGQMKSARIKDLSGAAVSKQEETRMKSFIPDVTDTPAKIRIQLDLFKKELANKNYNLEGSKGGAPTGAGVGPQPGKPGLGTTLNTEEAVRKQFKDARGKLTWFKLVNGKWEKE